MMKLVPETHEALSKELPLFDFNNPPVNPSELAEQLIECMKENKGLGLSANQVGLEYRVFVLNTQPEPLVAFNPRVVYSSDNSVIMTEGCLTYPDLYVKVRRPETLRIRYQDVNGNVQADAFNGIIARAIFHEIDHLNGIRYLDRVSPIHMKEGKRKSKLIKRKMKRLQQV